MLHAMIAESKFVLATEENKILPRSSGLWCFCVQALGLSLWFQGFSVMCNPKIAAMTHSNRTCTWYVQYAMHVRYVVWYV